MEAQQLISHLDRGAAGQVALVSCCGVEVEVLGADAAQEILVANEACYLVDGKDVPSVTRGEGEGDTLPTSRVSVGGRNLYHTLTKRRRGAYTWNRLKE